MVSLATNNIIRMPNIKEPKPIGVVTHYFANIKVAIVKFSKEVPVGTTLHYKGATTDFSEKASEMQFDHKAVDSAKKGKEVGIKVNDRVREGDQVFEAV